MHLGGLVGWLVKVAGGLHSSGEWSMAVQVDWSGVEGSIDKLWSDEWSRKGRSTGGAAWARQWCNNRRSFLQ